MSVEIKGLDDVLNNLQKLADNAKELDGTHTVDFSELFTEEFMSKHTQCSSFEDFLNVGGFVVNNQEDFEAIPDADFDIHVNKYSEFDSWEDMQQTATRGV